MKTSFDAVGGKWLSKTTDRLPGHDLYFGTPMNRPWAGIPIGDGDMGSLVWQERDGIHINIGKSDLWRDASPGFPKLKDITPKTHAYITSNNTILEVNPMKRLISCEYNFDNCCVEPKFTDGSMIAIDTIAVENEVADNMYQRSELDYLIYNAPLE